MARENRKIVGLVTVRNMADGSVFLQRLYIHPKHQRKAIDFYKKNGFMPVRKKEEKIEGQSVSVILMEKELE